MIKQPVNDDPKRASSPRLKAGAPALPMVVEAVNVAECLAEMEEDTTEVLA